MSLLSPGCWHRPRPLPRLTVAVVAALLSAVAVLPGGAAAPPPRAAGGTVTFGVQPPGPAAPDHRPYFTYLANPGATLVDHFAVENFGLQRLRLTVYASDAFTTA